MLDPHLEAKMIYPVAIDRPEISEESNDCFRGTHWWGRIRRLQRIALLKNLYDFPAHE